MYEIDQDRENGDIARDEESIQPDAAPVQMEEKRELSGMEA